VPWSFIIFVVALVIMERLAGDTHVGRENIIIDTPTILQNKIGEV